MNDVPTRISELTAGEKRAMLTRLLAGRASPRTSPLSYAQQRLWFLNQLAPGSAFYNMPIALRLRIGLDVGALTRTLNEIARRHEVLRTTFQLRDGEPVQVIAPRPALVVDETDLRALPAAEREVHAHRLATAESRRPFDLTRGPLLRAGLLRLGEQDHMLLLTVHHIISDGWSLGVLFDEISCLYAAFADGRPSSLPELPIQYADYASWQREWLQGSVLQEQLTYWKARLTGLPELVLPTDRPRPALATFRGARHFFAISPEIVVGVTELARRTGTTVFMVLLAAFELLMSRYSGQQDFPVGAPIANRTRKETEKLIGFFVNTLVLRADLSGDPTFRELLARVRETSLAAYAHQDLPFERLVEELHPRRDAARTPLIQVMFAVQNALGGTGHPWDGVLEVVEVERGTANFDLVLDLWQQGPALGGRLEFSTDLFDSATMDRLLAHYRLLLQAATAAPDEPISTLPTMTATERRQVLVDWNATEAGYPDQEPLSGLFEGQVAGTPLAPALTFDPRTLTYREVDARANQLAHDLRAVGVGNGDLVAIHLHRSAEHVLAILGVLKAGAAYVPLDPSYPQARLAAMLADAGPRAVVTSAGLAATLPAGASTIVLADALLSNDNAYREGTVGDLSTTRTGADPAYVMYTSGSTGAPKGIVAPQRAVSRLVRNTNYIRLGPGDRIAQASNMSFDASTFEIWGALLNGAELVGVPKEVLLSPPAFESFLLDHRITTLFLTTALFNQIASARPSAFRGLRTLLVGGETADAGWMREVLASGPPERLLNVYGPTECTTFATWQLVDSLDQDTRTVPIGRPVSNTSAYVLDANGRPVPVGTVGELYLGGPGLALGYLGQPERTAEAFVTSPFGRLYRTGDLVRMRSDLALVFQGRRDTQVKLRGHRIELDEIEANLLLQPAVLEAKVVLREATTGDRRLAAYLVLDPDGEITGSEPASQARVQQWRKIYDEVIYDAVDDHPVGRQEPRFNIAGWTSSYTGQPISPEEMREQVDQTVDRITLSAPADVLEIGCGTGLLIFRIAPDCRRYVATDFSRSALDYVARQLASDPALPVTLLERRADDFSGLADQRFDMVILNSVVQYFPDADYLREVVEGAARVLREGGTIFLGDVRNLALLSVFHTAVELHQASASMPIADLRAAARRRAAGERELVVAPEFFQALAMRIPAITDVAIAPKRGRRDNELTGFRYDVTLRCGAFPRTPPPGPDWTTDQLSIAQLRNRLLSDEPDLLSVERVPNARTIRAVQAVRLLDRDDLATAGDVRQAVDRSTPVGVHPEDLWALSDDVPYSVDISWARGRADGSYDVVFRRVDAGRHTEGRATPAAGSGLGHYTNHPEHAGTGHVLIPQVRDFLQQRVPEYMVPGAFVVLDRLPLTPNGKVDVDALPAPDTDRPALGDGFVMPRTALERVIADQWASVLGVDRIGVTDNFFELGGHSLLATQLLARITATLGVPLSLRTLFAKPTVADFTAELLAGAGPDEPLERVAALVLAIAEMPQDDAAAMLAARADPSGGPDR